MNKLYHWDDGGRMFRLNSNYYVCIECGYNLPVTTPGFIPDHEKKEIEMELTSWQQLHDLFKVKK